MLTWVGVLLDPLSHRIGLGLLHLTWLRPVWTWLYNLPLAPWTSFNNTVVLGSLVLGLALLYPLYRVAEPLAAWALPRTVEKLSKYPVARMLLRLPVSDGGTS